MEIAALYQLYLKYPSVQTDTRKLQPGDLFFALKGPSFNGNAFAVQALSAGAAYAIIDEAAYKTDDRCILVDDVLQTLQELARHHRLQLQIPFIAITGSNGKTTTKELVLKVLQEKYSTSATEGNLNNHIGVPLTLLKISPDAAMAIIEMGANHLHEIESYCKIALPTHGLITNAGKAHIEGFGGIEGVKKGKGELYDFLRLTKGTIFRNADLEYLREMSAGITNQVTYGTGDATYIGHPIMDDVFLKVVLKQNSQEVLLDTQLVGDYNFPNVMAAVAIGLEFGVPLPAIKTAIANYSPDNSRSQWLERGSNKVILDAYNANPTSMKAAILNFAHATLPHKQLWLGGMKEMGAAEAEEHLELVAEIAKIEWDQVLLVGKEFEAARGSFRWFGSSAEAAQFVKDNPPKNAAILIKGSRGSKMELLLEALPA